MGATAAIGLTSAIGRVGTGDCTDATILGASVGRAVGFMVGLGAGLAATAVGREVAGAGDDATALASAAILDGVLAVSALGAVLAVFTGALPGLENSGAPDDLVAAADAAKEGFGDSVGA